ncbi:MAG: bifunctional phosphoribosylaminoimidazolecarboxamide formyltransferase/IMP cyclohydrolase [Acidobacteriota bacterium]
MLPAQRALLSVSDKSGLADFARGLHELGIELISTGGTMKHIEEAEVPVAKVASVTGSPEILDGRVKTLHPTIHGGILADRGRASHLAELSEHGIRPIDLVVVNLYPFEETIANPSATPAECVEMIDIGGPCMLRAAAKNFSGVVVVVDPEDYPQILVALQEHGGVVPEEIRRRLALKAFRHTQAYDTAIANWLGAEEGNAFPERVSLQLEREFVPRYGENPHQASAIYSVASEGGVLGGMRQIQGKELSWNNMLDADATRKLASLFEPPTVVITKHNNPCGVGTADTLEEAYRRALACDPVSAFGSIIAVNRPVDETLAAAMADLFVEVVIAPSYGDNALARYGKKKNLRVLECPLYRADAGDMELRGIDGGFLAQTPDGLIEDTSAWTCPTESQPTDDEQAALEFNWLVCRYVKSNAIVVGNSQQTVGIGAGQMSRLDSCRLALDKAVLEVNGAVAASDAFFPFRDGLDVLAEAGIRAVVQPGGSKRDDEVIAAANEHGMAMLFTGQRHFRH